jgi:DNA invertase Pin-like site-specific DNA recombinase
LCHSSKVRKSPIISEDDTMVFSMAAEIERDLLSQRTKEALAARKRAGVKLGRPEGIGKSKLDQHRLEIEALLNNGATQKYIAQRYKTAEVNLSLWLAKHGLRRRKSTRV